MSRYKWLIMGMLFAAIIAAVMTYLKKADDYWPEDEFFD